MRREREMGEGLGAGERKNRGNCEGEGCLGRRNFEIP